MTRWLKRDGTNQFSVWFLDIKMKSHTERWDPFFFFYFLFSSPSLSLLYCVLSAPRPAPPSAKPLPPSPGTHASSASCPAPPPPLLELERACKGGRAWSNAAGAEPELIGPAMRRGQGRGCQSPRSAVTGAAASNGHAPPSRRHEL